MKITSRPLWWAARFLKQRNITQYALIAASLYGINEVYSAAFTARLLAMEVVKILDRIIRRIYGKRS